PQRLPQTRLRLVEQALVAEGIAEVVVRLRVIGLAPDRLAAAGDRLVELTEVAEDVAEVVVRGDVIRLAAESLPETDLGLGGFAAQRLNRAEAIVDLRD